MIVFKIGYVKRTLGISRKEIKSILFEAGIITKSWALKNSDSMAVELQEVKDDIVETTLLITSEGIEFIQDVMKMREEAL